MNPTGASFCFALAVFAIAGCALTEGRREAADCSVRHARIIRQRVAVLQTKLAAAPPEFAPVAEALAPVVKDISDSAEKVEGWNLVAATDHGAPAKPRELLASDEDVGISLYQGAAELKNLVMSFVPPLPVPGMPGGSGGGKLATLITGGGLAGTVLEMVRRKLASAKREREEERRRLERERDEERAAADDLHDAVEEMKAAAGNGGLKAKAFGEIMEGRLPARRKHARRKLAAVEAPRTA